DVRARAQRVSISRRPGVLARRHQRDVHDLRAAAATSGERERKAHAALHRMVSPVSRARGAARGVRARSRVDRRTRARDPSQARNRVMALDLYHWEPTANSGELLIALNEKSIAFTSRYVDLLAFEQHSPRFLALNPRGEVPVLVHDGQVLTETTLILEYLDAAFPDVPLVPETPAERYRMRVWTKLANDSF